MDLSPVSVFALKMPALVGLADKADGLTPLAAARCHLAQQTGSHGQRHGWLGRLGAAPRKK
jgi:hypothetical protein